MIEPEKINTNVKKCVCGNEYFEEVVLYQYRTEQTDIYNGQKKEDVDNSLRLMKCFNCEKLHMPSLSYAFMSDFGDQKLAQRLQKMVDKRNGAE